MKIRFLAQNKTGVKLLFASTLSSYTSSIYSAFLTRRICRLTQAAFEFPLRNRTNQQEVQRPSGHRISRLPTSLTLPFITTAGLLFILVNATHPTMAEASPKQPGQAEPMEQEDAPQAEAPNAEVGEPSCSGDPKPEDPKAEKADGEPSNKKPAGDADDAAAGPSGVDAGGDGDDGNKKRSGKRQRNEEQEQKDNNEAAAAKKTETKKTPSMMKTDSQFMRAIDSEQMAQPKKEDYTFPTNLAGFEHEFNKEGQLRHIKTGEPFEFKAREEHSYNQKRYEALGEVITDHVYELLESETKLKKMPVPLDADENEPQSFIFMTDDAMTNPDKLLLLIHGSGVVRAGQWARRLIINDCLDCGTQIPFIKKAVEEGYGVIVLNTNLNRVILEDGIRQHIRENASPEDHSDYVWQNIVSKAAAKHVAIIAHSYGGVVTTYLAMEQEEDFEKRVFGIAFTDSVHSLALQEASESVCLFYKRVARNWVASDLPLDEKIPSHRPDAELVSAGHKKHEWTSWSSFESIFKYLKEKYEQATPTPAKEEL